MYDTLVILPHGGCDFGDVDYNMKPRTKLILQFIPGILGGLLIILLFVTGREIEPEFILRYIPAGPIVAPLMLLAMYAVKSVSVFLPMLPLQLAAGYLFPAPQAIAVNAAGYALGAWISYRRGRRAGAQAIERLMEEHPRLAGMVYDSSDSHIFLSFLLRVIGMIPMDVTSMYLGFTGVPLLPYMLASIAGALPKIAVITLMGDGIRDPSSPAFIISAALTLGLSLLSALIFYIYKRRSGPEQDGGKSQP